MKVIPRLRRGSLGVKFSWSAKKRRAVERKKARKIGEKKVVSKLNAFAVLNKNRNPSLARKARSDAHYIAGSFRGRRRVRYPFGLAKKRKRSLL